MPDHPTTEDLKLVAQHGSGDIERMLAIIELAKRQGQLEELHGLMED